MVAMLPCWRTMARVPVGSTWTPSCALVCSVELMLVVRFHEVTMPLPAASVPPGVQYDATTRVPVPPGSRMTPCTALLALVSTRRAVCCTLSTTRASVAAST